MVRWDGPLQRQPAMLPCSCVSSDWVNEATNMANFPLTGQRVDLLVTALLGGHVISDTKLHWGTVFRSTRSCRPACSDGKVAKYKAVPTSPMIAGLGKVLIGPSAVILNDNTPLQITERNGNPSASVTMLSSVAMQPSYRATMSVNGPCWQLVRC